MLNSDPILLTINVDSRPLKLRVPPQAEEALRSAATVLNNKIDAFRTYSADPLDRISWAALDLAGDLVKNPANHLPSNANTTSPEELQELSHELALLEKMLNL